MLTETKRIEFNTGRHYTKNGQVVIAVAFATGQLDPVFGKEELHDVLFIDLSRRVEGLLHGMTLEGLTEEKIMFHYDKGGYDFISSEYHEIKREIIMANQDREDI